MTIDYSNPSYQKHALFLKELLQSPSANCDILDKYCSKKWDRRGGIYIIANKRTDNFYVGSTKNLHKRKTQHWSSLANGRDCNIFMSRDAKQYGIESFMFLRIHSAEDSQLLDAENFWIQSLRPTYNIQVVAKRIGDKRTNFGRGNSSESRAHYSAPVVQCDINGKVLSEYKSIKDAAISFGGGKYGYLISKACRGHIDAAFGFKWKYRDGMTPPKPKEPKSDPIIQVDPNTGLFIKEWSSKYEASKELGLSPDTYRKAAYAENKLASGFYWKYKIPKR